MEDKFTKPKKRKNDEIEEKEEESKPEKLIKKEIKLSEKKDTKYLMEEKAETKEEKKEEKKDEIKEEEKKEEKKDEIKSEIKRMKLEEGKTYFFICYALVCGGKSTFFNQIKDLGKENPDKYNIQFVSSDEIRAELSHQMQKKNPEKTFKECFDKVGKDTAKKFDQEISKAIKTKDNKKINIILVDKNYPQGIDKFLKFFCKDLSSQYFIIFIPNISSPINIDHKNFPFSLNYLFQCYLRLKNRHGHEVLNGEEPEAKFVYLSFFKLFQNFDFYKKICADTHYSKNVFLQKIDFTDESKVLEADDETKNFFKNVIGPMKAFDKDIFFKNYEEEVNKYFKGVEEKYEGKDFFEDTREKIKKEIRDILDNGIILEK